LCPSLEERVVRPTRKPTAAIRIGGHAWTVASTDTSSPAHAVERAFERLERDDVDQRHLLDELGPVLAFE
jgi:hypothetical protein